MKNEQMRLDDRFLKDDLLEFLIENGGVSDDGKPFGSYIAVWGWITQYEKQIENNKNKILQMIREKVPNRYITITSTCDDISTFSINIYGVRSDDEYNKNHKVLYDFAQKIEIELLDEKYLFLVHNVTLRDTVHFYENEMDELIKLGFATKEECDELRKQSKYPDAPTKFA